VSLIARFRCPVYAFDPTPRAIDYARTIGDQETLFRFRPGGYGLEMSDVNFMPPRNSAHVSRSITNLHGTNDYFEAPLWTLSCAATARLSFAITSHPTRTRIWRTVPGLKRAVWERMPGSAQRLYMLVRMRRYSAKRPFEAMRYLRRGRETDNFLYPIANRDELLALTCRVTRASPDRVGGYFKELEEDSELREWLRGGLATRADRSGEPHYGRRIVWYALVRHLRPARMVETGVHDGLGSSVLLRALERNATGHLYGMDTWPKSGWLIPSPLRSRFDLMLGSSLHSIGDLSEPLDLFVHDSDHRYEYEIAEYQAVAAKLAPDAMLISDNAHYGDALKNFAGTHGRPFLYCRELSRNHWYPGGGIGVSAAR